MYLGRYSPHGEGQHLVELERTHNAAVNGVISWIASIGLKLADHKTDVVLVTSIGKTEDWN